MIKIEFDALRNLFDDQKKHLDTVEFLSGEIYNRAVRAHLMSEGLVDYTRLNNDTTLSSFVAEL